MDVLKPELWKKFKLNKSNGKNSFDGKLFEDLIRSILDGYFEGQWNPTSITWDGGKDFVDRSIQGEESWAECKMYKSNLSIKAVSNTLVMAVNEKSSVRKIILFSYSPLNANAKIHLARYSESTDISVQVFDDTRLEQLILRSSLIIAKFFPTLEIKTPINEQNESITMESLFSTDLNVSVSQLRLVEGKSKLRLPYIPLNTPCSYEIIIRSNEVRDSTKLQVDLKEYCGDESQIVLFNRSKLDLNDNFCYSRLVKPSESLSIRLYLAPVSISLNELPPLTIDLPEKQEKYFIDPIPVKISRLNRPSLIGSHILTELDALRERASITNTVHLTTISGKSGVGKTRFIEEAQIRFLEQNFSICELDGRDSYTENFGGFITSLITQLWKIPNIHLLNGDPEKVARSESGETLFDRIYSLLSIASESGNELTGEIDELLEIVVQGILSSRCALLIDNVQKFDATSIQFLERFWNQITGTIGQAAVICAFNEEELVYSSDATVLHNQLKNRANQGDTDSYFIEIPEFKRNNVELFLNTICGNIDDNISFTDRYPRLTQSIHDQVLPRPLDLYQLFLAAQDKEIAWIDNGFFFIQDLREFNNLVRSINKQTSTILDTRLQSLRSRHQALRILILLGYQGKINIDKLQSVIGCEYEEVDFLIDAGWLKYNDSYTIDFYHPAIERFLLGRMLNAKLSREFRFLDELNMDKIVMNIHEFGYASEFVLMLFMLSKDRESLFDQALLSIDKYTNTVPTIRKKMYAVALHNFIIESNEIDANLYIDRLHVISLFSAEGEPKMFVDYLDKHRNNLHSYLPEDASKAFSLCKIMRELASYLNILGSPDKGDKILQEEINRLNDFPSSITSQVVQKIKVNYLNRRCVCLKSLNLLDEAEEVGLTALELARKFDFKEFICLTLIDLSVIYRNEKKNFNRYREYLNGALEFYDENTSEIDSIDSSIGLACLENAAQLKGLQGDLNDAVSNAENLLKRVQKEYSHYYMLRGITAKAVMIAREEVLLENTETHRIEELLALAKEIEDISVVAIFDRFYIKALHLQAILNVRLGKIERAQSLFSSVLVMLDSNLHKLKCPSTISPSEKALIWDVTNFWITYNIRSPFPIDHNWISSKYSDLNISTFLENKERKQPYLLFASGEFNFPFP